jgi:hypothetical protein
VIFGPQVDQHLLYRMAKKSPKNRVPKKSIGQNGKKKVELIRIIPNGVIRITVDIGWGNSDHSSRNS